MADSSFVAGIYDRYAPLTCTKYGNVDKSGLVIERDGDWSWGDWGENIDMGVLANCVVLLGLES